MRPSKFLTYKLKTHLVAFQNFVVQKMIVKKFLISDPSQDLIRLGSSYGGWWVPTNILLGDSDKVLISAGLGWDVSLDEELLKKEFAVIGIDPLEECVDFAKTKLSKYKDFHVINMGLCNFSGEALFYPPNVEGHDSWSLTNAHANYVGKPRVMRVITLEGIVNQFHVNLYESISILKMDIEGAEELLIPEVIKLDINFDCLLIEFDFVSLISFLNIRERIKKIILARQFLQQLNNKGYILVHNENFNFTWVKSKI
jgi:FkbM family methyltransferase